MPKASGGDFKGGPGGTWAFHACSQQPSRLMELDTPYLAGSCQVIEGFKENLKIQLSILRKIRFQPAVSLGGNADLGYMLFPPTFPVMWSQGTPTAAGTQGFLPSPIGSQSCKLIVRACNASSLGAVRDNLGTWSSLYI